jgi:hypothetical protein
MQQRQPPKSCGVTFNLHGVSNNTKDFVSISICRNLSGRNQINIANHAGVVQFSMPLALGNFLAQIRQPNIADVV